jgi:REP element-mobilizing transposase RayT
MKKPIMDPITHIHAKDLRSLPRTHQRSKFIDYKGRGIYLITLCTEGRRPLLGELCGDSPERAYVRPSALGQAVLRCWQDIPAVQRGIAAQRSLRLGTTCTRDIQLLSCQLMPDHFHGIIFIRQDMDIALGQVVYGFMVGCTRAYNALLPSTKFVDGSTWYSPAAGEYAGYCSNCPSAPLGKGLPRPPTEA